MLDMVDCVLCLLLLPKPNSRKATVEGDPIQTFDNGVYRNLSHELWRNCFKGQVFPCTPSVLSRNAGRTRC